MGMYVDSGLVQIDHLGSVCTASKPKFGFTEPTAAA